MRRGRPSKEVHRGRQSDGADGGKKCTCSDGEVSKYFCKQCQALICEYCKSTEHRHHDSQTAHIVAEDIRNNIQKYDPEKRKTQKMDSILFATQLIKEMKTDIFAMQIHEIDEIDKRLNTLHNELDYIRSKLVGKVTDIVRKKADFLNREERILNRTAASITKMFDAAKQMMTEADDIDVVRRGYSICEEMDEVEITMPAKGQAHFLKFIPGGTGHSCLQEMVGDISVQPDSKQATTQSKPTISVQSGSDQADTQTHKHSQPTTPVPGPSAIGATSGMPKQLKEEEEETGTQMPAQSKKQETTSKVGLKFLSRVSVSGVVRGIHGVCVTADKCWFTDLSPDIQLVDITGTRHRIVTVGGGCRGIMTDGRSMYVTSYNDRSIKKISTDHKVTNIQTSLSFSPVGLTCVPVTGELLVCGVTDGVYSVTDSGVQTTLTGVKFQDACDVAVSNNGDICVTDGDKVFIFNSDERHIGTYNGTSIQNEMYACGVTCDSRGNFIVADCNNRVLHFINRDGDNVSIYDTTNDCEEKPYWIDISPSGRLWISFSRSTICVYDMI